MTLVTDVALLAVASALLLHALGLTRTVGVLLSAVLVEHAWRRWHASTTPDKHQTLHRQKTWRFAATPLERARAETWTEDGDDVASVESADGESDGDAASAASASASASTLAFREKLFAHLSIRDVASRPRVPSAPSSTSSAATTASGSSSHASPRPPPHPPLHPLVELNAHRPIAFENDLFVGHVLFLVRTTPEDPRWAHIFVGKRRMFWIQVQGRFKRRPRGVVYLGGELPGRISLGLFTKSVALVIMSIIQQLVGKVYMSFGRSSRSTAPEELPAVSFPLYQSVDQFMMTPEGETPPPLGRDDFGESADARARRRQAPLGTEQFEVGPTYSFHFHTMYVDLTQWKTANLPGLSDMKLTTFFDSLPLRLVAYDVDAAPNASHLQSDKSYLFNFEVSYNPQHRRGSVQSEVAANTSAVARPRGLWRSDSEQSLVSNESTSTSQSAGTYDSSPCPTVNFSEEQFAVAEGLATVDRENANALRKLTVEYLYWIEEVDTETGMRRVQYALRINEGTDAGDGADRVALISAYKLRLLLAGKYRKLRRLYAFQNLRFHARSRIGSYSVISEEALQVASHIKRVLAIARSETSDDIKTEEEEALLVSFESALYQLLTVRTHLQLPHDGESLTADLTPESVGVKLSKRDRDAMDVVFEGVVYRFYADTVVRQEVLLVTSSGLHFYRSQSSSADKVVASSRVIGVQSASVPHAMDVEGFAFAFQINTFAEEVIVCVASEHARNTWIRVILQQCCPNTNLEKSLKDSLLVCYTPSKSLKPANRIILNSRSLFPRPKAEPEELSDPLRMVQGALSSALAVHHLAEDADVMSILDFLNQASALRTIDMDMLLTQPHEQRIAFFLNLYHVILAHAMISHGFPRSKGQWAFFQTHMCYAVGSYANTQPLTMSLAEIEHVILRARMPRPAELPHLKLDQVPVKCAMRLMPYGMAHPDFRISFALLMNHHNSQRVPIFDSSSLHDQLNDVVKKYITNELRVDMEKKTIFLPRICEWYREDFGGGGSPMYCVRKLLGFMDSKMQEDVLSVLDSPMLVHIKYHSFQYSPREKLQLETRSRARTDSI